MASPKAGLPAQLSLEGAEGSLAPAADVPIQSAAQEPMSTDKSPTFEDSVSRLGEIVERLEAGDLPLEDSLRLFEEGVRLARASQVRLDAAERRVEELLTIDEHGNPIVRELDPDGGE